MKHRHRPDGLLATAAALILSLTIATPLVALAQSDNGTPPDGPPHGHPHGPPPEAIAACKGKAVGTVASFTDHGGRTVSGACTQMGDVVAVPPPARQQGDGAPPSAH